MFSCNEAPAIDPSEDHTGTYRRIMIWDFPVTFTPNDPDPKHREDKTLRDKLMTEELMSGYLNYAIDGYKRLKIQEDFTAKLAVQDTRRAYIKRSDSPHAFLLDKCRDTDNENDVILSDTLFRIYIAYCTVNKLTRRSKGELTKAVRNYCPGAEFTKAKSNPDAKDSPRVSAWRFLIVSDLSDLSDHYTQVTTVSNLKEGEKVINKNQTIQSYINRSDNPDKSDRIVKKPVIYAEQFKPQPGQLCGYPEEDHCIEAEFKLNGNLYCPSHFEIAKFEQSELGKEIKIRRENEDV
jgi:phage/plasmid-associated DNA primase